ncbi:PulJ/GspJ family protein [Vibrio rotiferianus]|uniref:PulJ/GspJ family protein n=1 Tax=Vibrio rotiferianus TaxID=190895 RepID=UPI00397FCFB0
MLSFDPIALKTLSKRRSGFTLIEMLVSLVILSAVILIATSSYSTYMSTWDSNFGKFNQSVSRLQKLQSLHKTLVNTRFYSYLPENSQGVRRLYFYGTENKVKAISSSAFSDPDRSTFYILEIGKSTEGLYQLLYREVDTSVSWLDDPNSEKNFTKPIVVLESKSKMSFQYFGWGSMSDYNERSFEERVWRSEYNAGSRNIPPEMVKLVFADKKQGSIYFPLLQWEYEYIGRSSEDESV